MTDENKAEEVKEVVTPEESSTLNEQTQVETQETETKETPEQESGEAQKKEKKYVPLDELIKERQRRREMQDRLDRLEADVTKAKSAVEQPQQVREIMEDFGVDEDVAKKMIKHFRSGGSNQGQDQLQTLQTKFAEKARDVASDYSDWDDYRDDMTKLLEAEYLKNPVGALSENPEKYYLKAKMLRSQSEKDSSVRQAINKSNSQNLAQTESGKSSPGKPEPKVRKFTRAWLKTLSNEEYIKHSDEINQALLTGKFDLKE